MALWRLQMTGALCARRSTCWTTAHNDERVRGGGEEEGKGEGERSVPCWTASWHAGLIRRGLRRSDTFARRTGVETRRETSVAAVLSHLRARDAVGGRDGVRVGAVQHEQRQCVQRTLTQCFVDRCTCVAR